MQDEDRYRLLWTVPYRSQRCPAVCSLQALHSPLRGSQRSAWPLHWQGLQLGKPHWPGWQSEHWRPVAPCLHWHWPVIGLHWWLKEPSEWQSQAGRQEVFKGSLNDNIRFLTISLICPARSGSSVCTIRMCEMYVMSLGTFIDTDQFPEQNKHHRRSLVNGHVDCEALQIINLPHQYGASINFVLLWFFCDFVWLRAFLDTTIHFSGRNRAVDITTQLCNGTACTVSLINCKNNYVYRMP